jgi:FkbM family methyltransferase
MQFISYAQNFEDVMLWRALKNEKPGLYIDVGACDPRYDSVTCAFYERGWRGINVEPIQDSFTRIVRGRPDEINLQVALHEYVGTARMYSVDRGSGLSTLEKEFANRCRFGGREVTEIEVPVTTLANICREYVTQAIHFLKIDVEGMEASVLAGGDFDNFRPWIILLEATKASACDQILSKVAYQFVYYDGLNRFYIAAEHFNKFSPAFNTPPNIFDDMITFREIRVLKQLEAANGLLEEKQKAYGKARQELESCQQELFETNRHAAWLSQKCAMLERTTVNGLVKWLLKRSSINRLIKWLLRCSIVNRLIKWLLKRKYLTSTAYFKKAQQIIRYFKYI